MWRRGSPRTVSVVVAAHNEGPVIGRCLDALLGAPGASLEVVVAANGCTDDTVTRAARPGVTVLDLPEAGKVAALNAAEARVTGFPRAYLDADVQVSAGDLALLAAAVLPSGEALASVPARVIDVSGSPALVRAYYAVSRRHPAFGQGLFGRGVVVLSEQGRRRFERFPEIVADDLFLDSLFAPDEKAEVAAVVSCVAAPRRTRDLVNRLVRVRRGNADLRAAGLTGTTVRARQGSRWLVREVREQPALAPAAAVYVALTLWAGLRARRGEVRWAQDRSTRPAQPGGV